MIQYCRYCSHCTAGDAIYCTEKKKTMSAQAAKRANKCKRFRHVPLDALTLDHIYSPRKRAAVEERPMQGQMRLW